MAKSDADREWLARVSGIKAVPILVWMFAAGCGLILNWLLADWWAREDMTLTGFVALVTGWLAAGGGKNKPSGPAVKDGGGNLLKRLSLDQVVALATFVFLGALFVLLGRVDEHLITVLHSQAAPWFEAHPAKWIAGLGLLPNDATLLHPTHWKPSTRPLACCCSCCC